LLSTAAGAIFAVAAVVGLIDNDETYTQQRIGVPVHPATGELTEGVVNGCASCSAPPLSVRCGPVAIAAKTGARAADEMNALSAALGNE
jgi:hypothetical protein